MITGKLYNVLKFLALVALPAFGTLYFTLAGIWGLPAAEQVIGTIVAVDTFLGVILHISAVNYNSSTAQGMLNISETPDGKTFSLELEGDPEQELEGKDRVVFKVQQAKAIPAPRKAPRKTTPKRRSSADT